ncbi:MAG: type IV pilus biogenesis/stability protein PilW [Lautropia sp.]|nr:type IV pilus biogenesis/stability protein PilW [Lautropia sp.]
MTPTGWRWKTRSSALVMAWALGLAGCVTTETVKNGSGSETAATPVTSRGSPAEEKRRRAKIRLELAVAHYQQGNLPLALQEAEAALKVDSGFAAAYGMKGLIYAAMSDAQKTEESFQQALKLSPKDAELNNNYGWYLCQTRRQREAIPHFEVASQDRQYVTPAKPLHNAGICLMQLGDDSGAEGYLLRSFKLDPSNAVAMYNLGELYLKQGNNEQAKFYADRLLATYQPTAETLWLGIRVAREAKDHTYEERLSEQLRRRFPRSPEATRLDQRGSTYHGGQ